MNGRFQRELWNAALPLPPFDAAAKSAERGERTRSLAAEFNAAATSAPKSEQPSIIVVAVLTRERVESILTTHLLKNNLVRSLSSRLFKRGFNRAVRPESCLLRVSAAASARALSRKSQRGRLFAFIIFPREGKPPDRERHAGGDTRAGAKKVNATKSGDKRRKTQEQRDVHGDRVHAPDILMVSDLIERGEKMNAPFVPSFFVSTSLSAENICAAQITRGESNLKGREGGARIRGRSSLLFARLLRQLFKERLTARYGKMWNDKQRPQQSGVRQSDRGRQTEQEREGGRIMTILV